MKYIKNLEILVNKYKGVIFVSVYLLFFNIFNIHIEMSKDIWDNEISLNSS